MTINVTPRRFGALVLAAAMGLATLAPTAAEARRWRHHHHGHGGGVAAAAVGIGVLGLLAAGAAANARDRECWFERRRFETASGRIVVRRVKVCD